MKSRRSVTLSTGDKPLNTGCASQSKVRLMRMEFPHRWTQRWWESRTFLRMWTCSWTRSKVIRPLVTVRGLMSPLRALCRVTGSSKNSRAPLTRLRRVSSTTQKSSPKQVMMTALNRGDWRPQWESAQTLPTFTMSPARRTQWMNHQTSSQ